MTQARYELERELGRVVDRLTTMPVARAEQSKPACRLAAEVIVRETRRLTDEIPADAAVPDLGPTGLGAMIAVLGRDYLDAADASADADPGRVIEALVDLRRALP